MPKLTKRKACDAVTSKLGTLAALCCSVMLISCASQKATNTRSVVEADERMVESCRFLQTVDEKALIGTTNSAKKKAMKKAAAIGATHIVFTDFESANAVNFASATGRAYDCSNTN